jgi:Gpi18-like mannosyltransferase
LTSVIAGVVSTIKPMAPIEISIPLFPPGAPIIEWMERAFISPWMRWDALWYQRIVAQGYAASEGAAQFHPLFPWLAKPLASMGISPALSLLIISSLAGMALYYFFIKLAQFDLPPDVSSFALILFAFTPPAFIIFAPYAEALFLLAAVLCMIFLRQKSWWMAGLMGGLATLTRQQGLFLVIPMAWELWEYADHKPANILKQWKDWLALVLIPLGMLVWLVYRALSLNDMHINTANFQKFVYSIIISPSATNVVSDQQFIWPWLAIKNALLKLFTQPDIDIWVNMIAAVFFLVLLSISWKKIRLSYRLYALGITLISFSYYTGQIHPYMGLPRHLLLAFPIFIGLAAIVSNKWMKLLLVGINIAGWSFLLGFYVLNAWVP